MWSFLETRRAQKAYRDTLTPVPQPACEHRHWEVRGENTIGFGWCLDCQAQVFLHVLFNSLHTQMEESLHRLNERLGC